MKYTHFDDIAPNSCTEFAMLYFAAMRTMRKLEVTIRKTNGGQPHRPPGLSLAASPAQTLIQMAAKYKTHQRGDTNAHSGAKYPTGIVIDLKGSQGNVFYLIGLANKLTQELGLLPAEMTEFKHDLSSAKTYHAHLTLLHTWFGVVFVGH